MLRLVDVSHHNTMPDWRRAVAEAGVAAIVHKATEGTGYDYADVFAARMPAIVASGAVPGGYHFLRSGDGAAQARYFYRLVSPFLDSPNGFLAQLDHEGASYDPKPSVGTARDFTAEWAQLTGGHPLTAYFPRWFWQNLGQPSGESAVGPLWASHYVTGTGTFDQLAGKVPASWWSGYAGWSAPTILQFTSSGVLPGGVGGFDLNLFNGTAADLAALTGGINMTELDGRSREELDQEYDQIAYIYTKSGQKIAYGEYIWNIGQDVAALRAGQGQAIDYPKLAAAMSADPGFKTVVDQAFADLPDKTATSLFGRIAALFGKASS
jgi:GH25 family lysozyme M1 (1,4-beta-N-acetylmuramidase)